MAIVVEDGTEVTGANSYISVEDCATYLNLRGNTDWGYNTDSDKESTLIRAMDFLEQRYKTRWKGLKTSSTQRLSFPRQDLTDEDGRSLPNDYIPHELIDAQCILANKCFDENGDLVALTNDVTKDSVIKRKKEKVDVLEEETEYFENVSNTFYKEVDDILLPLLDSRQMKAVRG